MIITGSVDMLDIFNLLLFLWYFVLKSQILILFNCQSLKNHSKMFNQIKVLWVKVWYNADSFELFIRLGDKSNVCKNFFSIFVFHEKVGNVGDFPLTLRAHILYFNRFYFEILLLKPRCLLKHLFDIYVNIMELLFCCTYK